MIMLCLEPESHGGKVKKKNDIGNSKKDGCTIEITREGYKEIFIKILIKHELKTKEKNLKRKLKEAFDLRTK